MNHSETKHLSILILSSVMAHMKFEPTKVAGAHLIQLEKREDDRGFFARFFCQDEFLAHGLETSFCQINNSLSRTRGTLRGLHYQLPPAAEVKVVRCLSGALYDVVLDLRPSSPTFRSWFGAELTAENRAMMYVPRGCAHGFITLEPDTEALYLVSDKYNPNSERGIRFSDPAFSVAWPTTPAEISDKDQSWPLFDANFHGVETMRGLK